MVMACPPRCYNSRRHTPRSRTTAGLSMLRVRAEGKGIHRQACVFGACGEASPDHDAKRCVGRRHGPAGARAWIHRRRKDRHGVPMDSKGYDRSQYRASFVGIIPARKPRVIMLCRSIERAGGRISAEPSQGLRLS